MPGRFEKSRYFNKYLVSNYDTNYAFAHRPFIMNVIQVLNELLERIVLGDIR